MIITRMHNMTQPEAVAWVDAKLSEMMGEFGDRVSDVSRAWVGNVLKFRFRVSRFARFEGTLTVTRDCLHLDLPFRSREGAARDALEEWLDKNLPT